MVKSRSDGCVTRKTDKSICNGWSGARCFFLAMASIRQDSVQWLTGSVKRQFSRKELGANNICQPEAVTWTVVPKEESYNKTRACQWKGLEAIVDYMCINRKYILWKSGYSRREKKLKKMLIVMVKSMLTCKTFKLRLPHTQRYRLLEAHHYRPQNVHEVSWASVIK